MANTYVAVAFGSSSPQQVMSSPDAALWTAQTSPFGSSLGAACIVSDGAGAVVALGIAVDNTTFISAISTDGGATWTAGTIQQPGPFSRWQCLIYNAGLYVAVSFNQDPDIFWMTSTDGISWTSGTVPVGSGSGAIYNDIAFGAGLYVVVTHQSGGAVDVLTSSDGSTWGFQALGFSSDLTGICFGGGQFVAVGGGSGTSTSGAAATSPDGVTWTQQTSGVPTAPPWACVAYGAGLYVAMSYDATGVTMTSPDGITWTSHSVPEAIWANRIRFLNGQFVACLTDFTSSGLVILTSTDGLAWTQQTGALADWVWDVALSGGTPPPASFKNVWDGMTQQSAGNCLG